MDSERTVATALAGYLRQAGATRVFGYPGESVVSFMEAARDGGPAIIAAVREASAAFMAEGAAMRTGQLGSCLSTLGPGSTALLNGVTAANLDRVPLLAVSGQVGSSREQYWTHQIIDQGRLFAPVTKLAARLEPGSADTVLRKALRTAVAERPGAVHLTVTTDAFGITVQGNGGTVPPLTSAVASLDVYGEEPLRQLRAARRPVLLAGAGAVRCGAEAALADLASRAGMPVVVGPMAKGVLSEDHPYFAGVLDMAGHRVIWDLLASADLIVTAGFDPVELITPWRLTTPVLHVDTVPNIDQVYPAATEVVGNVALALGWLLAEWAGEPRWSEAEVAAHRAALRAAWMEGYDPASLNPSEVVTCVRAAAPEGTVMTLPVSTSSSGLAGNLLSQGRRRAMQGRVVGSAVDPARPDDADPGAGQYADGVRVVLAGGAGVAVDLGGPWAGMPAVVGEGRHGLAEPLVAGPAEADGAVLSGLFRDGGDPGQGRDGVGSGVGLAAVAPLGEHLGGVDLTRPWQRREDLPVRVLPEVGGARAVQVLERGVQRRQDGDEGQDSVAQCLGE